MANDRHQITTSSDLQTVRRLDDLAERTQMSKADVLRLALKLLDNWWDGKDNDPTEIPNPRSRAREYPPVTNKE